MIDEYVRAWAFAFGLTEVVELPIVVLLTRALPAPAYKRAAVAFVATLATHPIVWFVVPALGLGEPARVVASEAWATLGELFIYLIALERTTWRRAAVVSLVANAASFGVGLALWSLGFWPVRS